MAVDKKPVVKMPHFSVLVMPDGRRTRVRELGPRQGSPVVHLHGIPGSCVELACHEPLVDELDVRLISIERPGYGVSDSLDPGSVAGWARDLEAVADALELSRFGLLGCSGGGAFALAGAAALQGRVARVALTGCPSPFSGPEFVEGMAPQNRLVWTLASEGPAALIQVLAPTGSDPLALVDQMLQSLHAADAAIFDDPAVRLGFRQALVEGLHQGISSVAGEFALVASPWGFDLAQVRQRVDIWHGDADVNIPVSHAWRLFDSLPSSRIHLRAGKGHFEIHGPELLAHVLETLKGEG